MSDVPGPSRESIPTQLVRNALLFTVHNDPVCKHYVLTGKDGNRNFIATCNWNVDGEEVLSDDAE